MRKRITPNNSKPRELEPESPPIHEDWKDYFKDEELEKAYTYYKNLDQDIIKEEEIESDKSKDSCSTSESDLSDLDDLSEKDLKENVYVETKRPIKAKSPPRKKKAVRKSIKKDSM